MLINVIHLTWTGLLNVARLVWGTSRVFATGLAIATLIQSVLPAMQVWLTGQLIDAVVAGLNTGGDSTPVRSVVILSAIQLSILLASSLMQSLGNICQQSLQEKLAIRVQLDVMQHAESLDLAHFENSAYYDQLQRAQQESSQRPIQMVAQVF